MCSIKNPPYLNTSTSICIVFESLYKLWRKTDYHEDNKELKESDFRVAVAMSVTSLLLLVAMTKDG